MDRTTKANSRWILVSLAMLLLISVLLRTNSQEDSRIRVLGKPVIERQYSLLSTTSIDQIVDDGSYVYVLYGEHDGNVQVFTADGEYCYSAYFYSHMNGAFKIAIHDGDLYVKDERGNLYVIQDGICEGFFYKSEAEYLQRQIDFDEQSNSFSIRMGSVWRVDGDEPTCIIERPLYSAFYQGNFLFFGALIICLVVGWIRFRRR